MSMMKETVEPRDYSESMTKQSFKESTDINKLLYKAARGDSISHLAKHGAMYGDFSDVDDLLTAQARLKRGEQIFMDLPGEIRREFHNSPGEFFNYVNNPENADRLHELIPGLAERGTQLRSTQRTPTTLENDPTVPAEPSAPPAPSSPAETPPAE